MATEDVNLFTPIAQLIDAVNNSLGTVDPVADVQEPRWVRIGRAKDYKDETIGGLVMTAGQAFCKGLFQFHQLCLDLKDIVIQIDTGIALSEVAFELLKALPDAVNSLASELSKANLGINVPTMPNLDAITSVEDIMHVIPSPEDFKVISKSLYKMFSVGYDGDAVDLALTGKMRLLQWAMDYEVTDLKYDNKAVTSTGTVSTLGLRKGFNLTASAATLPNALSTSDNSLQLFEQDAVLTDVAEVKARLALLGYTQDDAGLKEFQQTNGVDLNGEGVGSGLINPPTIHALMHLDYANQLIKKAKPKV